LKISLSTGSLYLYPLRRVFALARETGYDGLEVALGPGAIPSDGSGLRRLSQEYGLPIFSIHPPMVPLPGRGHHHRLLPQMAWLARELDCQFIVIHAPKARSLWEGIGEEYVAAVDECVESLKEASPRLCLENQAVFRPEDREYTLCAPQDLQAFAERHGVLVTLDTAHAASFPYSLLEAYEALRSMVVNVHLSDFREGLSIPPWFNLHSYFKHHQIPGEGDLPLVVFLERLKKDGYDGIITVEVSPFSLRAWRPGRVRENLRRCLDFVRDAMGID
jgi:sugar phosphate isomerase/epimerase